MFSAFHSQGPGFSSLLCRDIKIVIPFQLMPTSVSDLYDAMFNNSDHKLVSLEGTLEFHVSIFKSKSFIVGHCRWFYGII